MIELSDTAGVPPVLLPDYFIAVLYTRLMDRKVLAVTSSESTLRAYAHCARGIPGAIAIAVVNLGTDEKGVTLDLSPNGNGKQPHFIDLMCIDGGARFVASEVVVDAVH